MTVVFYIGMLHQVGQARVGADLTNYLCEHTNHKIIVVTSNEPHPDDFKFNCEVVRLKKRNTSNIFFRLITAVNRIIEYSNFKKKRNIDISVGFGLGGSVFNLLTFSDEKKITSIHASIDERSDGIANKIFFYLSKFLLKKSWKIVPVSNEINNQLKEIYGIDNKLYAYNPIHIDNIVKLSKAKGIALHKPSSAKIISHMGRFCLPKAQHNICKIFVEVHKKNKDCKLVLIGSHEKNDKIGQQIYAYTQKYFEDNQITFREMAKDDLCIDFTKADVYYIPHLNNPFQILAQTDLFIFPSLWEGFPLSIPEAMACGLPVISANCSTGPKEILIDAETNVHYGILLPTFEKNFYGADNSLCENHYLWAEKIISVIQNNEELAVYAQKSKERAQAFNLNKTCALWQHILENEN